MNIVRVMIRLSLSPWSRVLALLGLAILAFASLIPAEHSPPRTELPGQVEHFFAYACVSALAALAFRRTIRPSQLSWAFVGYAAVLEYSQQWSRGRSASAMDFLASSAGALVGIAACVLLLHGLAMLDQVADRR